MLPVAVVDGPFLLRLEEVVVVVITSWGSGLAASWFQTIDGVGDDMVLAAVKPNRAANVAFPPIISSPEISNPKSECSSSKLSLNSNLVTCGCCCCDTACGVLVRLSPLFNILDDDDDGDNDCRLLHCSYWACPNIIRITDSPNNKVPISPLRCNRC